MKKNNYNTIKICIRSLKRIGGNLKRRHLIICFVVTLLILVVALIYKESNQQSEKINTQELTEIEDEPVTPSKVKESKKDLIEERSEETEEEYTEALEEIRLIYPEGSTLETRILTPEGFVRISASEDSLLTFLRNLELKPDGSPVMLYDNTEKGNQSAQAAVFAFDVGESDLQQCADSIMRVYGEYYWSIGAYEAIGFHLTNGFFMDYLTWREGKRIKVNGNTVSWVSSKGYDDSYDCFRSYLKQVMVYAGTLSLNEESTTIEKEDIQAGDIIIKGGSPGHCVLVVDVAQDQSGEQCYLLAQGYMPAQDFHILNNPVNPGNPWYYEEDLEYPIRTPEYTFGEDSIKRWGKGF